MTASRRQRIEALLRDDPGDTFLRYGLALEMAQEGEIAAATAIFATLATASPAYVPAFHMAGRHLAASGRIAEARRFLRDGIEEARRQGQDHAAGEMAELLMELGAHGADD